MPANAESPAVPQRRDETRILGRMIERTVLIRLKPEIRSEAMTVATHTQEVLGDAVGVLSVHTAVAADERTEQLWDVMISLRFESLQAVDRYRADPRHRKYLEVYLRPLLETIRAFNWQLSDGWADEAPVESTDAGA